MGGDKGKFCNTLNEFEAGGEMVRKSIVEWDLELQSKLELNSESESESESKSESESELKSLQISHN